MVSLVDVMATFAEAAGCELPPDAGEDSASLMSVLGGEPEKDPPHKSIVCRSGAGYFAVRKGKWKLMLCRGSGGWSPPREGEARKKGLPPVQLYNLESDPKETTNLAERHPQRVKELKAMLRRFVERGRSTPGPPQPNHAGKTSWPRLPWHGE